MRLRLAEDLVEAWREDTKEGSRGGVVVAVVAAVDVTG